MELNSGSNSKCCNPPCDFFIIKSNAHPSHMLLLRRRRQEWGGDDGFRR